MADEPLNATDEQLQAWQALPLPLPPPMATPPELAWLPQGDARRIYQAAGGVWPLGQSPGIGAYAGAYWPWVAGAGLLVAGIIWLRNRR
ncbi:hypothetical protein [Sediminicoccus sp. BL-A-41-H5]|uniref:hypothetical protein n=1 Tax=Sediminicoccus sp. BL-A-41-H5 TaxID=3421106 RepID=UPI003D6751E0